MDFASEFSRNSANFRLLGVFDLGWHWLAVRESNTQALTELFFHILHCYLLRSLMAGNGHRHKSRALGLMMSYKVDIFMTCVDHRLKYVIKVINVSILIYVEMAGLGSAYRI